jgi:hypothetical protein
MFQSFDFKRLRLKTSAIIHKSALLWMMLLLGCILRYASAQTPPKDWQFTVGETATAAREHWKQLTSGEELARGKAVEFFPKPNYPGTTEENDAYDLTDGTLSSRPDDRIWFNKDAVGWWRKINPASDILMVIDLGSQQPVGQIAIRVLGGEEQESLELPEAIEFLASADGKQYHTLQKMVQLAPAEAPQADGKTGFYFPQEGKATMVPLFSRVPVRARYVALRLTQKLGLFVDQISVLKATDPSKAQDVESFPKAQVFTSGFAVVPRKNPLTVTTNIITPNWFTEYNYSGLPLRSADLGFRLELPVGLRIVPQFFTTYPNSEFAFKEVPSKPGTISYEFTYDTRYYRHIPGSIGPFWIERISGIPIPADARAVVTGMIRGKDSQVVSTPINLVEIPVVPKLEHLDISLALMRDAQQQNWPNFLRDYQKMGFNHVSTIPEYFERFSNDSRRNVTFLQDAQKLGYKIVEVDSPFTVMWQRVQTDLQAKKIEDEEAAQLFTQIDGKRGKRMNILYRGKYYQDEIKRMAAEAGLVQPDEIFLDIEWWKPHIAESKNDPRVIAAWKQSGKEWEAFVNDIGTEVLKTTVDAIRKAVQKKLVVGLYDSDPKNAVYDGLFEWKQIYPNIIDIANPSLYVQGRAQVVHDRIRFDYNAMQAKQIIPWLSAGTYGEFDPKLMEPMILESVLNGARGVTYYIYGDFDPLDYYYHAKALASLAPYQTLLQNGKPIPFKGDNAELTYTCFASESEALLLVGNYAGAANSKMDLQLPFAATKKVVLDGKPLPIKNNAVSFEVPAGSFRLLYIAK